MAKLTAFLGSLGKDNGSWSRRDCGLLALGLKADSLTVPQGTGAHCREES